MQRFTTLSWTTGTGHRPFATPTRRSTISCPSSSRSERDRRPRDDRHRYRWLLDEPFEALVPVQLSARTAELSGQLSPPVSRPPAQLSAAGEALSGLFRARAPRRRGRGPSALRTCGTTWAERPRTMDSMRVPHGLPPLPSPEDPEWSALGEHEASFDESRPPAACRQHCYTRLAHASG